MFQGPPAREEKAKSSDRVFPCTVALDGRMDALSICQRDKVSVSVLIASMEQFVLAEQLVLGNGLGLTI